VGKTSVLQDHISTIRPYQYCKTMSVLPVTLEICINATTHVLQGYSPKEVTKKMKLH